MGQVNPDQWNDVWLQYKEVSKRKGLDLLNAVGFESLLKPDAKILDLGCGDGTLVRVLRERGYAQAMGLEPEAGLFAADDQDGAIRQGDCLSFNASGSYNGTQDAVLMVGVLHHLKDQAAIAHCLSQVSAALKKGGYFISMEPWRNPVRMFATWLILHTPLWRLGGRFRMERVLLKSEEVEMNAWLKIEHQSVAMAAQVGLTPVLLKRGLLQRQFVFKKL